MTSKHYRLICFTSVRPRNLHISAEAHGSARLLLKSTCGGIAVAGRSSPGRDASCNLKSAGFLLISSLGRERPAGGVLLGAAVFSIREGRISSFPGYCSSFPL